jgi:hypothetical protein
MAEKKPDEAYEAFVRAADLDPTCFHALNNLGLIALNFRKDYRSAIKWFNAACAISSSPHPRRNLATAEKALHSQR